ncbi:MAG: glycine cleavage system aminomethyltransferase GcvT [Bacteroidaceae bacterium]|nr:glycine cleavage system aminomethyltransferase GcvT [Bacteroidaceae bacterium]
MEENKRTCLYDKHVALGAKISPFGGFDMPIEYSSIKDEHMAVRHAAGIFDVSHMGEIFVSGADAEKFVNHIFTNDVTDMPYGKILYGIMCYPDGGSVDDLLVYRMHGDKYLLVVNAANIDKDEAWIRENSKGFNVDIRNESDVYGQVAVQGPEAEEKVERLLKLDVKELAFYTFKEINTEGETIIVSRTGYTGEDGFEIYGSHAYINRVWDILVGSGEVAPCGLGCRDTLRFEVALPLYGHELSPEISPLMAGLGIFVKLDKEEFIGKEALLEQKTNGVAKKVVGIELNDKAIPRNGYPVEVNGEEIGTVTTGYHGLSVDKSIAMALIDARYAALGTEVEIRIRKKTFPGTVVKKKFYNKNYKK